MDVQPTPINAVALLEIYSEFVRNTKDWSSVSAVIKDRTVTGEKFQSVIPTNVAEFALFLRTPLMFAALLTSAPEEFKGALATAKQSADAHFVGIEEHPAAINLIQSRLQSIAASRAAGSVSPLTEFTNFNAAPLWIEGEKGLTPVVAIALQGTGNRQLLKATLDWDDLSFLALAALTVLNAELQRAHNMTSTQKSISVTFNEATVGERISSIIEAVREIGQTSAKLRLPIVEKQPTAKKATQS